MEDYGNVTLNPKVVYLDPHSLCQSGIVIENCKEENEMCDFIF